MNNRPLPLSGVTVIDLGQIYNGPYCTFLMAMAGARVIKIEPKTGENLRRRAEVGGASIPFAMLNSNKQCVTLNLKTERGRDLLIEMVRRGDVLVENFAPGVMDRLGVGYEVLQRHNRRLVYASGSGYGLTGPYRDYPAMDITVQAMSGAMSINGFIDRPPVKVGPAICDFFGGVHLYAAVVTALFECSRTGEGRLVEVSMQEAVYASMASNLGLFYASGGDIPPRTGNRHGGMAEAPYNVYPTTDGFIAVICAGEVQWQSLLKAIGREDLREDERYAGLKARVARMDEVDELVAAYTCRHSKADVFRQLMQFRVPCAPVRDLGEVQADEHLRVRKMLQDVDHPIYGKLVLPNSPVRFNGSELASIKPSGRLGQHNGEIFGAWLGLSEREQADLVQQNVI